MGRDPDEMKIGTVNDAFDENDKRTGYVFFVVKETKKLDESELPSFVI